MAVMTASEIQPSGKRHGHPPCGRAQETDVSGQGTNRWRAYPTFCAGVAVHLLVLFNGLLHNPRVQPPAPAGVKQNAAAAARTERNANVATTSVELPMPRCWKKASAVTPETLPPIRKYRMRFIDLLAVYDEAGCQLGRGGRKTAFWAA